MIDNCVVCGKQAVHTHHRKLRSQGGGDEKTNLLRVCLDCHTWIHANPSESYARGLLVHSWADPALVRTFMAPATDYSVGGHEKFESPTSSLTEAEVTAEWLDAPMGPLSEGEPCPTCKRRVPHTKKKTSPKTKVFSARVPVGDVDTFNELVDAAAEHMGAKSRPHHVYFTLTTGLALILQSPKEHLPGG